MCVCVYARANAGAFVCVLGKSRYRLISPPMKLNRFERFGECDHAVKRSFTRCLHLISFCSHVYRIFTDEVEVGLCIF